MCDPSLTRAILSAEVSSYKKRYTNVLSSSSSASKLHSTVVVGVIIIIIIIIIKHRYRRQNVSLGRLEPSHFLHNV